MVNKNKQSGTMQTDHAHSLAKELTDA